MVALKNYTLLSVPGIRALRGNVLTKPRLWSAQKLSRQQTPNNKIFRHTSAGTIKAAAESTERTSKSSSGIGSGIRLEEVGSLVSVENAIEP